MANMKIVSMLDAEVVKARTAAAADTARVQERLLVAMTVLAENLLRLSERVTALERRVQEDGGAEA